MRAQLAAAYLDARSLMAGFDEYADGLRASGVRPVATASIRV
jgi:hypothetical protein